MIKSTTKIKKMKKNNREHTLLHRKMTSRHSGRSIPLYVRLTELCKLTGLQVVGLMKIPVNIIIMKMVVVDE